MCVCVCLFVVGAFLAPTERGGALLDWSSTLHFIQYYFSGRLLVLDEEFAAVGDSYYIRRVLKWEGNISPGEP